MVRVLIQNQIIKMIAYYYTGADAYNAAQTDKDKSLGGYVSSSPLPNDIVGALFGDISNYTISNKLRETKAVVLKNQTGSDATSITTWFENLSTHPYINLEIAAVSLYEDTTCTPSKFSMEQIINMRATPISATFYSPSEVGSAVGLGDLAPGEMIGIWIRMTLKPEVQDYLTCENLASEPIVEVEEDVVWHLDWT